MNKIQSPSVLPEIFSETAGVSSERKHLPLYNVCFLGHVDAGKSTTVTRILYDTGRVDPHLIEQFRKEAEAMNKGSFKFAWLMDRHAQQRKRGITIDLGHAEWSTPSRYYTIIDAPGHKDFTRNTIVGTSQADLVVLVVDAKKGLMEAGQTEQHTIIARASGVSSIVVALTKVDTIPLEQRMSTIKQRMDEVAHLLANCGFSPQRTIMVPVDSWNGVNISSKDKNAEVLPGYDGPTLIEALDTIPLDQHDENLPFRLSVENLCTMIGGTNVVVTGKVMSGKVSPGDKIIVKPSNAVGTVRSIQMHHKNLSYATSGANVGIDLKGIKPQQCTKASIVCHLEDRPAKAVDEFTIEKAVIRKHPTALNLNSNIIVHYQTGNVCAKVKSLSNVYQIYTKKTIPGPVESVNPGSIVDVVLVPDRPIVVEPKNVHPRNSRVMLRDSNDTIGWGSVSSVHQSRFEV